MHMCVCVFVHLHISDIGRYVNRCPWTQYAAILHMTSMRSQFLLLLKCSLKCCHEKCNGMADHSRYTYRYIHRYAVKTLLADTSLKLVSSFNEPFLADTFSQNVHSCIFSLLLPKQKCPDKRGFTKLYTEGRTMKTISTPWDYPEAPTFLSFRTQAHLH